MSMDKQSSSHSAQAPATNIKTTLDALTRVHEIAEEYLASLAGRPVGRAIRPQELAAKLVEPLPEGPSDPAETVSEWFKRAEPGIFASSGPRFFGFVNGGSTPAALAGDWLASAIDQNAAFWAGSPASAETEQVVLRWLKELLHLPSHWAGGMTSGATMSNLTGLAVGRQWIGQQMGFDPARDGLGGHPPIVVISSTEIHASARKALATLGLGRANVRTVVAINGSIDIEALAAELTTIKQPVLIVANAGDVNTGAFDDLNAIADLRDRHPAGAWLHVDGAFGLFAAASPRFAHFVAGIERADSVCVDAHKWLNVPYDSGFAFVRDEALLRSTFAATAAYIEPVAGAGWEPASHVPEMSRRFRALAAWCALKAAGRSGYRNLIERCCDNAAAFADWVNHTDGLELLAPAPLNIVCWRYLPVGADPNSAVIDEFNRAAVTTLQTGGQVFVSPTTWRGHAAVRCAFDNWLTTQDDIAILKQAVLDVVKQANNGQS